MGYEIPKNLKYQEKIVFNLTFQQMLWLGLFGLINAVIFLKTKLFFELKIFLIIIFSLIGIGFAFLNLLTHLKSVLSFFSTIKPISYFDSKMNSFLKVQEIDSDAIFLKNNKALAIIQVHPINFSILSKQQQKAITSAFKDFLNSLDFPIQIVMRTIDLNLDEYLTMLKKRVIKTKKEHLITQFNEFQNFLKKHVKKNTVKNRLFYIIVPSDSKNKQQALNELINRSTQCMQKLKKCNLLTERLNSNKLVSLLASFFDGFIEENTNYFSPIPILEKMEEKNV